jgi:hypothetical protein
MTDSKFTWSDLYDLLAVVALVLTLACFILQEYTEYGWLLFLLMAIYFRLGAISALIKETKSDE